MNISPISNVAHSTSSSLLTQKEQDLISKLNAIKPTATNLDLSMAFQAKDFKIGTGTRNCCNIRQYNEYFCCNLYNSSSDMLDAIDSRPYIAIFQEYKDPVTFDLKQRVFLIKNEIKDNKNASELQILENGQFVTLTDDRLKALKLNGDDRILFFNVSITNDMVAHYHSKETPNPVQQGEPFYHEKQKEGQCGIHALNACVGFRAATSSDMSRFNSDYYSGGLPATSVVEFASEYEDGYAGGIADASSGNNPATLNDYIHDLAKNNKLDARFSQMELHLINKAQVKEIEAQENQLDRMIVGHHNPDHFVAFRKNQNDEWIKIDSEDRNQEMIKPSEFMASSASNEFYVLHLPLTST